jgi:hypothetical protein
MQSSNSTAHNSLNRSGKLSTYDKSLARSVFSSITSIKNSTHERGLLHLNLTYEWSSLYACIYLQSVTMEDMRQPVQDYPYYSSSLIEC